MIDNLKVACCLLVCGFVCVQAFGNRRPWFCYLPPTLQSCDIKPETLKYFYNRLIKKCEVLHYALCYNPASRNQFDTIAECRRVCNEVSTG
ncbi:hypothetical protein BsWGS_21425 [Bradybaena similaris]